MKEVVPGWDVNPEKYLKIFSHPRWANSPSRTAMIKAIGDNGLKNMLECGFGGADDAILIHESFPNITYTGIDRTVYYQERAVKNCPFDGFAFILGNMTELPFKDNAFEFVYSKYTLEHQKYYKTVLKEMIRVANNLVMVVFFKHPIPGDEDKILLNARTTGLPENTYALEPMKKFIEGLGHECSFEKTSEDTILRITIKE